MIHTIFAVGGRTIGILVALCAALAAPAFAELPTDLPADSPLEGSVERQALIEFQRDPVRNAQALLAIGAGSVHRLPTLLLLAVADVHLRAGRTRSATRFFREVARRDDAGPPWTTFAELGLGWAALLRSDYRSAERHYGAAADDPQLGPLAEVMIGWVGAVRARGGDEAAQRLDEIASRQSASHPVRQVAYLGAGYARYWHGDYAEAAEAFDRLALAFPSSPLVDDARYAAAWSRVRAGDAERGIAGLVALAATDSDDAPGDADTAAGADRARIELAPRAVLRAGQRRVATTSGFAAPDVRMVASLDADGRAMARRALALVARPSAAERQATVPVEAVRPASAGEPRAERGGGDRVVAVPPRAATPAVGREHWPWAPMAVAAGVALAWVVLHGRRVH
jgi:hypothetical protein